MFNRAPKQIIYPTRQDPNVFRSTEGLVQAAFVTIRNGLGSYQIHHASPREEILLDEYTHCSRGRNYTQMGILTVKNGFVLLKTTKGGLLDYSHRLKVPTDGTPAEYHRDSFNEDIQCMPATPLTLVGEEQIARNKDAVIEVLAFERDVLHGALTNWDTYAPRRMRDARC